MTEDTPTSSGYDGAPGSGSDGTPGSVSDGAWYSDPGTLLETLRRVELDTHAAAVPEIAGYRDLVEIARGGQGVVFTAVQTSTNRRVAVKVLTPRAEHDDRARRRFEREVNLAARLRHPNIVRLYDSGTTEDGRLFCVMDFIEGGSLRDRLHEIQPHRRGPVPPEVLELFRTITLALSAAHQHGVIHRDLKPSNVRVDHAGTPYLLDFGLAKAVEGADALSGSTPTITEHSHQFAGSIPWASPEQVAGDPAEIDVRTDIYSLGVMLHHAVTGKFPYKITGSIRESLNAIAETPPAPARSVRPTVGRDLETVILTCLAKDKARRYQSAAELAEDLRRVIAGEPILAQADTAWQAVNRSIRRYRAALALIAIALVSLAGFGVVMSLMYTRATQAEAAAHRESARATTVNEFLKDMLASPDPGNMGRDVTVREVVDRAAAQLDTNKDLEASVRASLHAVIASTYASLGAFDLALDHATKAEHLSTDELGPDDARTLEYRDLVANELISLSRFDEAEPVLRDTVERARTKLGDEHPVTLTALSNLAIVLSERGAYDEAIEIHDRVHAIRVRTLGESSEKTIVSLHHRAIEESNAGRYDESLADYREAATRAMQALGPDHPTTLMIRSGLAVATEQQGDAAGSAAILRELVPIAERVWGPDHRETNILKSNLAFALDKLGDYDESLALMRAVYESARRTLGDAHTDTINAGNGLAGALYRHGDYADAAELLEESRRVALEQFGPHHVRSLDSGANLAQVLRTTGDLARASQVADEVLADARAYFGDGNPELAWYAKVAGDIRLERGDTPGAVERLEEARALADLGHDYDFQRSVRKSLAKALAAAGRRDDAQRVIDECVALMRDHGEDEDAIREVQTMLGGA
ncbi:MAG: serine/threonine-protein kinase [Phycisphaerales bacterium]